MATAKISGLLKQGWKEIPEVIASGACAIVGAAVGLYVAYYSSHYKNCMKTYRYTYTVLRDDDPKVEVIKKYGKIN